MGSDFKEGDRVYLRNRDINATITCVMAGALAMVDDNDIPFISELDGSYYDLVTRSYNHVVTRLEEGLGDAR